MPKSLNNHRNTRYKTKMLYIQACLTKIEEVLPTPSGIVLMGVFYAISTAIEAAIDMVAMLCKDMGIMPKGDYENIQSILEQGLISKNLAEDLKKCNGLRNFLVHQYNGVDDDIVLESIPYVGTALVKFNEIVEVYLSEH
ncbi:MAG: type VII toxin-antitoxin system HepT family RNase toxin [Candidatus Thorarchaeota archaeon]